MATATALVPLGGYLYQYGKRLMFCDVLICFVFAFSISDKGKKNVS